jgi:hypothetical protein
MGWAKEQLLREQEEGWHSIGEKFVCAGCFEDEAIRSFVKTRASEHLCSYCGKRAKKPIAAPLDDVLEYVPTQVITEFFRHLFKEENGQHIDGIAYRSSKTPKGICYTLFLEQDNCVDSAGEEKGIMLLKGATRNRAKP